MTPSTPMPDTMKRMTVRMIHAMYEGKSVRCVDGRLMRHDPQPDDPELQTDIGECPECNGKGCDHA